MINSFYVQWIFQVKQFSHTHVHSHIYITEQLLINRFPLCRLKNNKHKAYLVSSLLDAWCHLRNSEQSMLTEAVEQLSVNSEVASSILKVLHDACDKLRTQSEFANLHVLILVGVKFLSLYSSKHAHDLCASDILLIILLCWVVNKRRKQNDESKDSDESNDSNILLQDNDFCTNEKVESTFGTKLANPTLEDITDLFSMFPRLAL